MRYPIIKVRDKLTGETHIVGTDTHDVLYVSDDGGIHYYNLQNGEGTGRNGDYEFVGVDNEFSPGPEIEFVLVDQTEVQRLREALDWVKRRFEEEWTYELGTGEVVEEIIVKFEEALSTTTEPTGAGRVKECPECGAPLIENRWCSRLLCKYGFNNPHGINAKEKVETEEWRHKYFGAEWPKVEGAGNDA